MTDVPCVPVVPIRMTEAWLLLDEAAIRRVSGNPNSNVPLNLPRARDVETVPDPKEVLAHALATALGFSGRRLEKLRKRFPYHRQQLLERIEPAGPIRDVPSWQAFNDDLLAGLKQISE
ncbi:MAG TPA: hypothetical protein VFQ44_23510 [Streptosporangiaceae bacterium]|nr:hypothetical protein [Streptosporangiaceae bacterium]